MDDHAARRPHSTLNKNYPVVLIVELAEILGVASDGQSEWAEIAGITESGERVTIQVRKVEKPTEAPIRRIRL